MKGFEITCRSCGVKMIVAPGDRNQEAEPISFGTAAETYTFMSCRCGNAIESEDRFEPEDAEPEERNLVEYWVDASKRPADESVDSATTVRKECVSFESVQMRPAAL